jgi:hypothetical protein
MPTLPIVVNPSPADGLPVQYARVSLPLARGSYPTLPPIHIQAADGSSIPCQARVLGHWPDGTVRMVHLVFQAPGGAYEAHIGQPAPAVAGLSVRHESDRLVVQNGDTEATCGGPGLLRIVRRGQELFGEGSLEMSVGNDEGRFLASSCSDVVTTIEEEGPLRVAVALRGKFTGPGGSFLTFRIRLEFLAGVDGFSLAATFFNLETGADFHTVRFIELALRPTLAGDVRHAICQRNHGLFGVPHVHTVTKPVRLRVDNTQAPAYIADFAELGDDTDYPFYLRDGMNDAENWGAVSDAKTTILAEMDDFEQLRPKSLRLEKGALIYDIWPEDAGPLELQQGRSREVTMRVAFLDSDIALSKSLAATRIAQLRDIWRGQLPADVYAKAKFFDLARVLPFDAPAHPRIETWLGSMSTRLNSVATFFDLGDTPDSGYRSTYLPLGRQKRIRGEDGGTRWFSSGYHHPALAMNDLEDFEPVWVNNEYDVIFAIGTEYVRTGDLSLFQKLRWFSHHTIEVDFLHYSDHKWMHRAQPAHSARHTTTGAYPSHFWSQGLAQYYFLSGDLDALEVIIALADKTIENLDDPELGKMNRGLNREVGWGILTLVCAYEASGEKRFDDFARFVLESCLKEGIPADLPVFSFGHTSLLLGLRQYLQVHEGEENQQMRQWFLDFVDRAVECVKAAPKSGKDSAKSGHYSYDEERAARGRLNSKGDRKGIFGSHSIALDSLAYAYEITGDPAYIEAGFRSVDALVDSMSWLAPSGEGKPYAMLYRTWINYFGALAGLGYLKEWEYRH